MKAPPDRKYSETHEWFLVEGDVVTMGITQHAADELTDIFGGPVDIVVFGYTHEALVEEHQGILFVNPGSTNMIKQIVYPLGHVALLDLTPTSREARIIDLKTVPVPE